MKDYKRTKKYNPKWVSNNHKDVWMPWAEWSRVNFSKLLKECNDLSHEEPEVDDVDFLNADTGDDLALIVMTARKK